MRFAADAAARGIDQQYVRTVFTDQIAATEGIEYTRFGQWKFDPSPPPRRPRRTFPNHALQIDGFNKKLVEEIALHWNSLHSAGCGQDLSDATAAVATARQLDGAVPAGADVGDSVLLPTLLEQPRQPPVGQHLAAGLAGRAVLERLVGERHLAHGVAADRARQPGAGVHPQPGALLPLQRRGLLADRPRRPRR